MHDQQNFPLEEAASARCADTSDRGIVKREVNFAYERARAAGEKPPDLIEVVAPVRASLAARGYNSTVWSSRSPCEGNWQ